MSGGRFPSGRLCARLAALPLSLLWLLALLSVIQWSVASMRAPDLPRLLAHFSATETVSTGEAGEPAAYAQVPATPAVAEKRSSVAAGPAKSGSDGTPCDLARDAPGDPRTTRPFVDAAVVPAPVSPDLCLAWARAPPRPVHMARRA